MYESHNSSISLQIDIKEYENGNSKINVYRNSEYVNLGGKTLAIPSPNIHEKGNELLFVVHVSRAGVMDYLD
jgi:hypothetical protein